MRNLDYVRNSIYLDAVPALVIGNQEYCHPVCRLKRFVIHGSISYRIINTWSMRVFGEKYMMEKKCRCEV